MDQWDRTDWSRLWWVRANLSWIPDPDVASVVALAAALRQRSPQYRSDGSDIPVVSVDDGPFAWILVLRIVGVPGWAATAAT